VGYRGTYLGRLLANRVRTEVHRPSEASQGFRREDEGIRHCTSNKEAFTENGKVCDYEAEAIVIFDSVYRKHAKVDDAGTKSKPAELSQDDIEAAKKEWETIVLSEGEDNI
jgi:hypothetical protein